MHKLLPREYRINKLFQKFKRPILISPIFIPDLLINKKMIYRHIKKYIVQKMVNGHLGNSVRFFLAGVWEPYSLKEIIFPFKRNKKGVFLLPNPAHIKEQMPEKINPKWMKMVVKRTKLFASRGIFVGIDLVDNCSLHLYRGSHWGLHWMNPRNNDQDTHPENAAIYHYYEYWPGGPHENVHPPAERLQWWASGVILEEFYRFATKTIWSQLTPFERKYVGFNAGNEVVAGVHWHERMSDIIDEVTSPLRFPRWKKFTSMHTGHDWHLYKKLTHRFFNYSVHGIGGHKQYEVAKGHLGAIRFISSCDGFQWPNARLVGKLTLRLLRDGQLGYELLEGVWDQYEKIGPGQHYDLSRINWKPGRRAMAALKEYVKSETLNG